MRISQLLLLQLADEIALAINTDAHSVEGMNAMAFGVSMERRGWLEKKDVINAWPLAKLKKSLR